MLPKARPRATRRRFWLFGKKRNRRVRPSLPPLPAGEGGEPTGRVAVERPAREPGPPLSARLGGLFLRFRRPLLVAGVAAALAGGVWLGRWYVTHSRHFAVAAVRVAPATTHVSAEALIARAGVPLGVNLFAIDRDRVARAVSQEPWIARVHVRRELPATLVLDVVERQPACAVALGALYLADADGNVFKRATPDEAAALTVVTGIQRDDYVAQPEHAKTAIAEALRAAAAWRVRADRPALGEVHVDKLGGVTLYTDRGVGVRIGAVDDTLGDRLHRYDVVAAALAQSGDEARVIYVDNRARPDRVTVKLASAQIAAHSEIRD